MKNILLFLSCWLICAAILPAQNTQKKAGAGIDPTGPTAKAPLTWRCGQPFTDPRDGQVYQTVPIVNNCWMQQNLNFGTQIAWNTMPSNNGIVEKYCYDDLPGNCAIYGGLYRFGEANQYSYGHAPQGACPPGWHIPTDGEYMQMHIYLNVQWYDFGGMLKETGFAHWSGPNTGATNSTGFTALGAGKYEVWGSWYYYNLGTYSYYWLSHNENAQARYLVYDDNVFHYLSTSMPYGFSVRCVYDLPVSTQKIQNIDIIDTRCYQAIDTIQTGGDNTYFNMYSSANVTMISGSTIRLLPGTSILSGMTLLTQINPGGPYCSPPGTMPFSTVEGEENQAGESFHTFPNPTDGLLIIEPADGVPFQAWFRLTDLMGNQVMTAERGPSPAHRFDIAHLPPGIYFLSIMSGGKSAVVKVVRGESRAEK
jgi:uncharacterized protein (TIGR02145 family)